MRSWGGYVWAVVVTLLAALTCWAIGPTLSADASCAVFYVSTLVATVAWGWRPGLVAGLLGALAALVASSPWGHLASLLSVWSLASLAHLAHTRLRAAFAREAEVQQALREVIKWRQIALDSAEMGTFEFDARSFLCTVDERCRTVLGLPQVRFHYAQFRDVVHAEDRERVDHANRAAIAPGTDGRYDAEYRVVHADGSVHWVAANGQALFEGEGESRRPVRVIGTAMDVTARKEAENALREAAEWRQVVLDAAEMGTWELDPQSGNCIVDERCRAILGMTCTRFPYPALLDVLWPEDRERVDRAHQQALDPASDGHYDAEYRVQHADGSLHWATAQGQAFFVGKGAARHAVRLVGMVMDITARKEAEERLRASEELLRQAVGVSGIGVFDFDFSTKTLQWSPRLREIRGFTPDQPVSIPAMLDCLHPDDRQKMVDAMTHSEEPAGDGRFFVECRMVWPDGSVHWTNEQGQVFFGGEGPARHPVRAVGAVLDITERKQVEVQLRTSEQLLRQAVRISGFGVFQHDFVVKRIAWSPELREMFGWDNEGPQDIPAFLAYIHPDDRPQIAERVQQAVTPHGDGLCEFDTRILRPDGTVRWISLQAQVSFEGEGPARHPIRSVGVVLDITERKQAEEQLRASEELLQQVVRVSSLGIFDHDHRTDTIKTSARMREISGDSHEEPNLASFFDHVHPDDLPRVVDAVRRGHEPSSDGFHGYECRMLRPDGTVRWVSLRAQTFFEGEGPNRRAVRTVGAMADITDRKLAEEQLRTSEELFRAFFDNVAVGTAQVDLQGGFLQVNDRYCQITGYSREELLHMNRRDVIHPEDWPRDEVRLIRFHQGEPPSDEIEERYVRKDGSVIWVQVDRSLVRGPDGRPLRVVGVVQEITARKEAERAVEEARRVAEEARAAAECANQAKSQFLAHMSHELRTPMNSILGMTELALQESLSAAVRDCLQTVKDSADSLLVLINEVLDLSRIEAGVLLIEAKPFRVRALLDDTLKALALRASEKDLDLGCLVAPEVPDRLIGDPLRLRQILTNLLGNAIKFTERGGVVAGVELLAQGPGEVRLRFAVTDTGIGIAPEQRQRIFAPFVQADPSMTRRYGGSGLGLAIVARLVDMLGGQVSVESQLGRGSTFSFIVTLGCQAGPESPSPFDASLATLRGQRVLLADRHAISRQVLEQIVAGWSIFPVVVEDARAALAQLQAAADAGQRCALAVLDATMPGIAELRLLEQLREDARIKTPIVLTVSPPDKQRLASSLGSPQEAVWLEKPFTPAAVAAAFVHALGGMAQVTAPAVCAVAQTASRSLRILLAEDTPANQKLTVRILSRRGHSVAVAQNGEEALDQLRRGRFDVVLMDVQMPVMDGFQATAAIRKLETPEQAQIPIIAMTAHALKGDQEKCLAAGMDAYISKPIDSRELIALVEQYAGATGRPAGV
jgi:PAS domain S-box-containing protein